MKIEDKDFIKRNIASIKDNFKAMRYSNEMSEHDYKEQTDHLDSMLETLEKIPVTKD